MKLTQDEMHELEILTLLGEKDFDHNTCDNSYIDLVMKSGKKAFKIIKKQQEEIKRLESKNKRVLYFSNNLFIDDYISKEAIREKIKELSEEDRTYTDELSEPDSNFKIIDKNLKRIKNQTDILKELLGE